jgi:hypothetical protein
LATTANVGLFARAINFPPWTLIGTFIFLHRKQINYDAHCAAFLQEFAWQSRIISHLAIGTRHLQGSTQINLMQKRHDLCYDLKVDYGKRLELLSRCCCNKMYLKFYFLICQLRHLRKIWIQILKLKKIYNYSRLYH